MKTKLIILLLLIGCFTFALPTVVQADTTTDIPINTTEVPSESYLRKEKRSIAGDDASPLAASTRGISSRIGVGSNWDEGLFFPGDDGETGNAGNVGGPIGDATLPVVLSILLLYIGFRRMTTSRRKNDI